MATSAALAAVLGFAYDSPTTEFPVRSGPGTNFDTAPFRAQKGWRDLQILDVQPDSQNTPNDNDPSQVYQWFKCTFPNGQIGWLRSHVVGIYGDCKLWGYEVYTTPTYAYTLRRMLVQAAQAESTNIAQAAAAAQSAQLTIAPPTKSDPAPKTSSAADALIAAAAQVKKESAAEVAPRSVAQPARPSGEALARIKAKTSARTRSGPATTFPEVVFIERHTRVPILEVQREKSGQQYRWFRIKFQGQSAWIREDLVTCEGDTTALGLPTDLYPAPMKENYWWVRGFNMPPNIDANLVQHDGWDLGALEGEPIYCGPNGGLVVKSFQCAKCTPERPSTLMNGYSLGDPSIFQDEGWGFGYGNYIIVRYLNEQLPQSTRDELARRNFPGGHLYVMYAHLQKRMAEAGMELAGGQQFATCGNTGNSEAAHIHLEVRASREANFPGWANIRSGLMDAVVLFQR
jgi:hypothetical protein